MISFMVRRLVSSIPVFLGIALLVFVISHMIPGDAAQIYLGTSASPRSLALLRAKFGLNQPLPIQFFDWLMQMLHGSLGQSITQGVPVKTLLMQHFPVTLELTTLALLLAISLGVFFGAIAASFHNTWLDHFLVSVSLLGLAIPDFWLGTMLVLLFSLNLGLLPSLGYVSPMHDPIGNLRDMILPSVSLAAGMAAVILRMTRSAMLEVMGHDFIRTAAAKGVSSFMIQWRHVLRNALIPVVTIVGIQFGYLLGGTVIIEDIFALPGVGRLALSAINQRDYPTLQAAVLWLAASFVLVNLLVDVLYGFIDPRIHYT